MTLTPSTSDSMSTLARQCFNALSATAARRWATSSLSFRQLSTNDTSTYGGHLWAKLLDNTNASAARTKLRAQSPDEAWLAQHKKTINYLTPPNDTYAGMPLAHSLPTRAQRSFLQAEAFRSGKSSWTIPLQGHKPFSSLEFGGIE